MASRQYASWKIILILKEEIVHGFEKGNCFCFDPVRVWDCRVGIVACLSTAAWSGAGIANSDQDDSYADYDSGGGKTGSRYRY